MVFSITKNVLPCLQNSKPEFSLVYSFFVFNYSLEREFLVLDAFGGHLLSETGDMILYLVLHVPFYFSGFYLYRSVVNKCPLKKVCIFLAVLFVIPLVDAILLRNILFAIFAFFLAFGYGFSEITAMVSAYSLYAIFATFSFVMLTHKPIANE